MKKSLFLAGIAISIFSIPTYSQVGSPGNFEKYEFQPEAWKLPDVSAGSVNEHGDYSTSIGLASISAPSGLSFNFSAYYSSDIHYDDVAGWLGLGWQANPGTISRSVRGTSIPFVNLSSMAETKLLENLNPVDLPENLNKGYWDQNADLYNLTLPGGQSIEFSINQNSINRTIHSFIIHNEKGYTISAIYSPVSEITGSVSVGQSTFYAGKKSGSGIIDKDYSSFLVEAPNGIRYLYNQPTLELNIGPAGNQTIYVSTWRIVAIISPWYQGDLWTIDINSQEKNPNLILFSYSNEKLQLILKENPVTKTIGVNDIQYEAVNHFKYLKSVFSVTDSLVFSFIDDQDIDKKSKVPVIVQSENLRADPPVIGSYNVVDVQGRKRIAGLTHYKKFEDSNTFLRSVTFDYEESYSRSFLKDITDSDYSGNSYSFRYNDLYQDKYSDFDYSIIWDYYQNGENETGQARAFLAGRQEYDMNVFPWDINGYFKPRVLVGVKNYSNNGSPHVGQLSSIVFPTGKVETILYNRISVTDCEDVNGSNTENFYKRVPVFYNTLVANEFIPKYIPGVYNPFQWFGGNNFFFKSCPDSIIQTDRFSDKRVVTAYQITSPIFPGTVREMGFNNILNLKEVTKSEWDGNYYFHGIKGQNKGVFTSIANLAQLPWNKGDYRTLENPKDSTTNMDIFFNDGEKIFQLKPAFFYNTSRNWFETQSPISPTPLVVLKASRAMDAEDKVWFGNIIEIKNGNKLTLHETQMKTGQKLALMIYKSDESSDPRLALFTNNYHLVNIGQTKSHSASDEGLFVTEKIGEKDDKGTYIIISPRIWGGSQLSGDYQYTARWKFKKENYYHITDGNVLQKSFSYYDVYGNKTIQADFTGKINDRYQFAVVYNRFAYEEPALLSPTHQAFSMIQQLTGIWDLDSSSFANADSTHDLLRKLEVNLRLATGPNSSGDEVYKSVFSNFKMTGNEVKVYKKFENNIFSLKSSYKSKDWKWYRFTCWDGSTEPDGIKWNKIVTITAYTSFGVPISVDYGRFKENYYFGSKTNPWNTQEDSIYYYLPTGRTLAGQKWSKSVYSFSAKYDQLGRIKEASTPNKNRYTFYYDSSNRLNKIIRNGNLIRSFAYDLDRDVSLNNMIRISKTDYLSNLDSVITCDFFDGFGVAQSISGNSTNLKVTEPIYNKQWEPVGSINPHFIKAGTPEFVNPFQKTFITMFSNGGDFNISEYSGFGLNKKTYNEKYYQARKGSIAFANGTLMPVNEKFESSFGSYEESNQPGLGLRKLKKSKRVMRGRFEDNYLVEFKINEDNQAQFFVKETDGKLVMEGSVFLADSLFSSKSGNKNNPNRIGELITKISKLKTEKQGLANSDNADTPDLDDDPPILPGGDTLVSPSGDVPDPEQCIKLLKTGSTELTPVDEICAKKHVFTRSMTGNIISQPRARYVSYFDAFPFEVGSLVIDNLPKEKTLNLLVNGDRYEGNETVMQIKGPIVSDTIPLINVVPGKLYQIDYFRDLGCGQDSTVCPRAGYFISYNLMNLVPQSVTNYTYNDLNKLVKVTHPDGSETCYAYDFEGKIVRKETPYQNAKLKNGTKPEEDVNSNPDYEYVYDQYGQLRMSIDPNQSVSGKMSVFTYDGFGRLFETGEMTNSGRFTLINAENPAFPFLTTPLNPTPVLDIGDRGAFTAPADYIWNQQYYYDASDTAEGRVSFVRENVPKSDGTMGLFTKDIKYRKEGWVVKVKTIYPNGVTQDENVNSFDRTGKPLVSDLILNGSLYQRRWNEYSPFGELTKVWLSKTATKPGKPTFSYEFTKYGELAGKSIGNIDSKSFYGYTEEGWLESLEAFSSSTPSSGRKLFGLKYNYFKSSLSNGRSYTPQYSGNIGQILTTHKDISKDLLESFIYDSQNRLVGSNGDYMYKDSYNLMYTNVFNTSYSYDIMGNILNLRRNWESVSSAGTGELKDNFVYQYDGSKLRNLVDLSPVTQNPQLNLVTSSATVFGPAESANIVYPGILENFESYPVSSGLPSSAFYAPFPAQISITSVAGKGKVLSLKNVAPATEATVYCDTIPVVGKRNYQLNLDYCTGRQFDGEIYQSSRLTVILIWLAGKTVISESILLNGTTSSVTSQNASQWFTAIKSATAPNLVTHVIIKLQSTSAVSGISSWIDNLYFSETNLSYSYDNNGNVIQDKIRGINGIIYNSLNLPTQLTTVSQNVNYGYLWSGGRWFKKTGTQVQYYLRGSGGELIGEYTNTVASLNYLNMYGADLEGKIQYDSPGEYYYVKDHLGNVRQILKNDRNAATIVSTADYYPFGAVMRETNSLLPAESKFKYQSKEGDLETGYDYFEARMYDSQLGRFLQVDPLFDIPEHHRLNSYNMTSNNPINRVDLNGKNDTQFLDSDGNEIENVEDGSSAIFQKKGKKRNEEYFAFSGYDSKKKGVKKVNVKTVLRFTQNYTRKKYKSVFIGFKKDENGKELLDSNGKKIEKWETYCNFGTHFITKSFNSALNANGNKIDLTYFDSNGSALSANDIAKNLANNLNPTNRLEAQEAAKNGDLVVGGWSSHAITLNEEGLINNVGAPRAENNVWNPEYGLPKDFKFYIVPITPVGEK